MRLDHSLSNLDSVLRQLPNGLYGFPDWLRHTGLDPFGDQIIHEVAHDAAVV